MNPRLATVIERQGERGGSLRGLVGASRVQLDGDGVRAAFGEVPADGATCIAGAHWSWLTVGGGDACATIRDALVEACARAPAGRVALALSGGVDSAVLAALLGARATVYTLESNLSGYCEAEEAQAVADHLGIALRRVRVDAEAFVGSLPDVIRGCEAPLYNLHPVSRHLLARAVRADGFDVLITGDGADEVFGGTTGGDYLPIVGALTRAVGLAAWAPFLDPAVAATVERDPGKRALRELAVEIGVPAEVAFRAKRPRFAPALDLGRYWDAVRIAELGRMLGRTPTRATDRACVGWTTLGLFAQDYPGLERCAA